MSGVLRTIIQARVLISLALFACSFLMVAYSLSQQPLVGANKFVMMMEQTEELYREGDPTDPESQGILEENRERTEWLADSMDRGRDSAVVASALTVSCFIIALLVLVSDPRLRKVSADIKQANSGEAK